MTQSISDLDVLALAALLRLGEDAYGIAIKDDIAARTGGQYFRAQDLSTLREVFDTINELEKSEIIVHEYSRYRELYGYCLLPAVVLLLGSVLLGSTRLRRMP